MIPQLGIAEILIIAILALVVVGPKDLPVMMRKAGQFVGKIKRMGQEFKDAFNEMGAEDELAELKKEIADLKEMGKIDSISDEAFEDEMRMLDRDISEGVDLNKDVPTKETSEGGND